MPTTPQEQHQQEIIALSETHRVVPDGPLGALYAQALHKLYDKEVDPATGVALESQVNDHVVATNWMLANLAATSSEDPIHTGEAGMLYGVTRDEVSVTQVLNVADALAHMSPTQKTNSGIVLVTKVTNANDGLPTTETTSLFNPFAQALEEIATHHGVKTYPSLEVYLQAQTKTANP